MKASLYVAYHKPASRVETDSIIPIHAGRALAPEPLSGMIGDDTGETISERNASWCELTALYWAWKNDRRSDLVGLMHYRRLLDLTDRFPRGPVEAKPRQLDAAVWGAEVETWLAEEGGNWDIVLPRLHRMGRTVEQNYRAGHAGKDWDVLRETVARHHPDYVESFEAVAADYEVRLGNMALMARPLFERYCAWLFDILFRVDAAPEERSLYSPQQARYLGFLAERLLTVFVHHEQRVNPQLRLREVSILNLARCVVVPYISPGDTPDPETINIAFAADRAYLPHAAAMLRSILDHTDPMRPLNLFFLHDHITEHDIGLLASMLTERPNCTLHPIDIAKLFKGSYRSASRAPSNATYNRFLLFQLLPGLDRLLYLDADIIVRRDLSALYDTEMGKAQIAAVPDWIMTRTLTGRIPTIDPTVPDLAAYHREVLGLTDGQIARYFNAGVLLFNFAEMPDLHGLGAKLVRESRERRYLFRDQDILNCHFRDRSMLLDGRWNVFNSPPESYNKTPQDNHACAMKARADPWIVHYADRHHKPWNGLSVSRAGDYWQALIRTPFYAEVVARVNTVGAAKAPRYGLVMRLGHALSERIPMLKGPMLYLYARLRRRP